MTQQSARVHGLLENRHTVLLRHLPSRCICYAQISCTSAGVSSSWLPQMGNLERMGNVFG